MCRVLLHSGRRRNGSLSTTDSGHHTIHHSSDVFVAAAPSHSLVRVPRVAMIVITGKKEVNGI